MSDNPHDTQFAGFAKLLLKEIDDAIGETAKRVKETEILNETELAHELGTILAQRAYDLVCYTVRSQAQGIEILCRDDPEYIRERVEVIPDMDKWPDNDGKNM